MAEPKGRNVSGILFADYVRMLRANKAIPWRDELPPEDIALVEGRIDPAKWYPMESFERLGTVIFKHLAGGDLDAVRLWGEASVDQLIAANPMLVAAGDPVETINRFRVLRASYFDFDALTITTLTEDEARIVISYYMSEPAEEAASRQAQGFFRKLLEHAGASAIVAEFSESVWEGGEKTVLALAWIPPRR